MFHVYVVYLVNFESEMAYHVGRRDVSTHASCEWSKMRLARLYFPGNSIVKCDKLEQ